MKAGRALALTTAVLATLLAGCSGGGETGGAGVSPTEPTGPAYYLSLGDSAAAGFQPIKGQNTLDNGYANQLYGLVQSEFGELRMVKMGCSGESTETFISGKHSPCPNPSGSQLDEATNFLQKHRGHMAFITITMGGNDVVEACFNGNSGVLDLACVRRTVPGIQQNLAHIVDVLQKAAPGVPIAGMSYWNPFLGIWVSGPGGPDLARKDAKAFGVLNAGLVSTYRDGGALVADVAGPESFDIADFDATVKTEKFGELPVNVANACTWTWACTPPPRGPDIHPNTEGYGVIAQAFQAVLPL